MILIINLGARLSENTEHMWWEVDFLQWTKIIGVKTQSRADEFELVQTYTVSYGGDRKKFAHVKENNQIKVRNINTFTDIEGIATKTVFLL